VPTPSTHGIVDRLNRYLDRLLDKTAERLAPRVADRVAEDLDARIATLEVLTDPEAMDDLRAATEASDDELVDYDVVRREVGLA
jgi:hypothetical protein